MTPLITRQGKPEAISHTRASKEHSKRHVFSTMRLAQRISVSMVRSRKTLKAKKGHAKLRNRSNPCDTGPASDAGAQHCLHRQSARNRSLLGYAKRHPP